MPSSVQCPSCGKFYNPKFRTGQCPHEAPARRAVKYLEARYRHSPHDLIVEIEEGAFDNA